MLTEVLVLVAFGVLSGVTTVLFGFGGGFVVVPVLYALTAARPDAMHVAVGTSNAVMVVNSAAATVSQYRAGRLIRADLWPLAGWIAVGAVVGALAATAAPDAWIRVLFALYLVATILDTVVRRGFLRPGEPRRLGPMTSSVGGVGIGAVASFLGVGGSVLTVPLMRRRGRSMARAVAAANPLSFPVAATATVVYLMAPSAGPAVDPLAAAALLGGSLPTIPLARRLLPRIPDRVHAVAYVGLLGAALLAVVV